MTANDRVSLFIHELCQMDRFGGRCIRLDIGAWEVLDVAQWTEEQTTALRHRFPSIATQIVANRKSLSGFAIQLRAQRASHAWTSLLVCAILIAANAALAQTLASSNLAV